MRPLAGGVFEIILPVQFKAGEVISLDEPEKFVRGRLECLEADPVDAPKRFREKTK